MIHRRPVSYTHLYVYKRQLLEALQKLNERERQIFLARTLEEEDFETLGVKFDLSYKGAAALYYRTIQKIRKSIEGGDKR